MAEGQPTGAANFDTTYTATDNGDGATAKAYYHLTLHDPVEKELEDQVTTYDIEAPLRDGGTVAGWYGKLPLNVGDPPIEVTSGTSTETGYDVTATVDVSLFKSLLGFSVEGNHSSTKTLSIEQKTTVPDIPAGKYRYLIVAHKFQRRHTFFWKYDEGGKVRRMVTADTSGFVFNHDTVPELPYDYSGGSA